MTEDAVKKVKDVFKDYEAKGNIQECEIKNINMFKKTNKLSIDLFSKKPVQIGEKLAFQIYLKGKLRVQDAEINITVEEQIKPKKKEEKDVEEDDNSPIILGSKKAEIKDKIIKIKDITVDSGKVVISGKIIKKDLRELKTGNFLLLIDVYDGTSTIACKAFLKPENKDAVMSKLGKAKCIKLSGNAQFDTFSKEINVMANIIIESEAKPENERMDNAKEKRVELHLHTQMSQMDGVSSPEALINRARKWGMKSIAITDHRGSPKFSRSKKSCR